MAAPADQDGKNLREHDGNWTTDSRSFGMLSGIDLKLFIAISGQPIVPTFEGEVVILGLLNHWKYDPQFVSKCRSLTTNLPCITSQKNADLIYIAAET